MHHTGHKSGELIVVGEHQFGDRHRVVLVDNRNDIVLNHHADARLLVLVLAFGDEVLFHRQHLTNVDAIFAEERIVEVHELHLSHSRVELTLFDAVQRMHGVHLAPSASHSTRRNEYQLMACCVQHCKLIDYRREPAHVDMTVWARQYVASYFYYCKHWLNFEL